MTRAKYFPDGWRVEKSQDYCAKVADGTHDTPKPVNDGKKLVTSKNIKQGRVNFDDCYFISENDFISINRRSKVDKGDVLFSMIGTVGEIALVKEDPDYAIKNIGLFKPKSFMDGVWLYYYFTSQIGQSALDTFLTGTSQQFVSLGDLRKVPVVSPPDGVKKKIAAVLSAYDELIENNNRRIAILEKMAEELYREWFVRLRFPGHEKVKVVKGVPEGWELKRIGDVVSFKYGFTESAIEDNQYPKFLRVMDINKTSYVKWSEVPNCRIDENTKEKYELKKDDLVIARMASPGKVAIIERDVNAVFASYLIKLSLNKEVIKPYYIFYTLRSDYYQGLFTNADTSATRGNINGQIISRFQIIVPPIDIQNLFNTKASMIRSHLTNIVLQNEILGVIRDRLLSRLMSGKIDVENMDIEFPASMKEELVHA